MNHVCNIFAMKDVKTTAYRIISEKSYYKKPKSGNHILQNFKVGSHKLQYRTVQYSRVPYSTVQYSTVQ